MVFAYINENKHRNLGIKIAGGGFAILEGLAENTEDGNVRFLFLRPFGRRTEVTGLYWAAPEQMAWSKIMR